MFKMSEYSFVAAALCLGLASLIYLGYAISGPPGRPSAGRRQLVRDVELGHVRLEPADPRAGPLWHDHRLAGARHADDVADLPDDRDRARPVRQHVRVLDRLRLGHPRRLLLVRAEVRPADPRGPGPADRARHDGLRGHDPVDHRAPRPGPPEQPPPDRSRRRRDRRLRLLHGRASGPRSSTSSSPREAAGACPSPRSSRRSGTGRS